MFWRRLTLTFLLRLHGWSYVGQYNTTTIKTTTGQDTTNTASKLYIIKLLTFNNKDKTTRRKRQQMTYERLWEVLQIIACFILSISNNMCTQTNYKIPNVLLQFECQNIAQNLNVRLQKCLSLHLTKFEEEFEW